MRTTPLASTLRCLADEGPAAMYTGSMAERVARHFQRMGGPLRAGDLAAHRAGVGQFVAVEGNRLVGASDRRHDGRAVAVLEG
jgi:gamma-glutamyltranspeptidase